MCLLEAPIAAVRRGSDLMAGDRETDGARTRQTLLALLEAISDPAWVKDGDLRYVAVNEAFARLIGRPASEIIGQKDADVFPADFAGRLERLDCSTEAEARHRNHLQKLPAADGTERLFELVRRPVRDEAGGLVGSVGVAREVSGSAEGELRILRARHLDAVARLAGGIAHDFNNLLTVIDGSADLLMRELEIGDPRRAYAEDIRRASERSAALTRQLLAYGRQQVLEPRQFDLNELVRGLTRLIQRLLGEPIQLTTNLAPDLWPLLADSGQVEQVVMNLVVNARDAMPEGGRLVIETSNRTLPAEEKHPEYSIPPGDYVELVVSDTGTGMTAETRSRLFEPFYTTKGRGKGTGLGLATVYGIVKQSGGYIGVESSSGRGAHFRVLLPRRQAMEQPEPPRRDETPASGPETVLVVEDEAGVRTIVVKALARRGYRTLVASSPSEALALARSNTGRIDLLLTDVVLPEMSGRELSESILQIHPEARVLYTSGYTDDAIVQHGVRQADTAFLQKPFSPAALTDKVRNVLDSARGSHLKKK